MTLLLPLAIDLASCGAYYRYPPWVETPPELRRQEMKDHNEVSSGSCGRRQRPIM